MSLAAAPYVDGASIVVVCLALVVVLALSLDDGRAWAAVSGDSDGRAEFAGLVVYGFAVACTYAWVGPVAAMGLGLFGAIIVVVVLRVVGRM